MKNIFFISLIFISFLSYAQNPVPIIKSLKIEYCEGDSVKIISNVTKSSNIKLFWFKDNFWLPDLGADSVIVIHNATANNSGSYQLLVKTLNDSLLTCSNYLKITVFSSPTLTPPNYVIGGGLTSEGTVFMKVGYSTPWTIEWYAPDGTPMGVGISKSAHVDASMHNQVGVLYFVLRGRNEKGCLSHNFEKLGWSVGVNPPPMLYSDTPFQSCEGSQINFNYIGGCTNGIIRWYRDSEIASAPAINVTVGAPRPPSEELGRYVVTCVRGDVESVATRLADISLSAYESPTSMTVSEEITIRPGETASLHALGCLYSGGGNEIHWFDDRYGKEIAAGANFTTPVLTDSKIYYVACGDPCGTTFKSVKVNVIPDPASDLESSIDSTNARICLSWLDVSNAESSYEVEYSEDRQNFKNVSELNPNNISSLKPNSTRLCIVGPISGKNYCFRIKTNGIGGYSYSDTICVDVPCANNLIINDNQDIIYICAGISVTLTVSNCFGNITWSNGTTGSQLLVNSVGTYQATCSSSNCKSISSKVVQIVAAPTPALSITNPAPADVPATINLTNPEIISGSFLPPVTTLSYMVNNMTVLVNPTNVSSSGTYYIRATTDKGCIDTKQVIVIINNCFSNLTLNTNTTNNFSTGNVLKQTNAIITASNMVSGSANVTYRSGHSILLTPEAGGGFIANKGTVFKAEIGGCQETGLMASYTFEGNANDVSGNGHHAIFNNAELTTGRNGNPNSAYSFNGIDQSIGLGDWFNYNDFTITMWVNPSDIQLNAYADIIDNNHGSNVIWVIQQDENNTNNYYAGISGNPATVLPFTLTANKWQHIAIVKASDRLSIYINGNQVISAPHTGNVSYAWTPYLRFGAHAQGLRYWNGKLDDIKIYNRPLVNGEITGLFEQ